MKKSFKILIIGGAILVCGIILNTLLAQYVFILESEYNIEHMEITQVTVASGDSYTKSFDMKGENNFELTVWSIPRDSKVPSMVEIQTKDGVSIWNSTFEGGTSTTSSSLKPDMTYQVTLSNFESQSLTYSGGIRQIYPDNDKFQDNITIMILRYYPIAAFVALSGFFIGISGFVIVLVGGITFFKEKRKTKEEER